MHNHDSMHKQFKVPRTYLYDSFDAECRRRRCLCHAKQSSTSSGTTSPPPVFTSPDLAGSAADGATLKREPPPDPTGKNGILSILKRTIRATERQLSNLQLAIAELAVLAFLSGVGTIIDQEQVIFTAYTYWTFFRLQQTVCTNSAQHTASCPLTMERWCADCAMVSDQLP